MPQTECFLFISNRLSILKSIFYNRFIGMKRVGSGKYIITATGQTIAVQHMNIIISPNRTAPTVFMIGIRQPDIHLMHRFIQNLFRQFRIAFIDSMKVRIAQFNLPMISKSMSPFQFHTANIRTTDIFKTIYQIRSGQPFILPSFRGFINIRRKIHHSACKIRRHIIANMIIKHSHFSIRIIIFPFQRQRYIHRFFRFQLGIAQPIPSQSRLTAANNLLGQLRILPTDNLPVRI